jgi:hypothetical protein
MFRASTRGVLPRERSKFPLRSFCDAGAVFDRKKAGIAPGLLTFRPSGNFSEGGWHDDDQNDDQDDAERADRQIVIAISHGQTLSMLLLYGSPVSPQ